MLLHLAEEVWLRGRAELALGQLEAARATLLKAKEAAGEAQEERAIRWQILDSQADAEETGGVSVAAGRFREQAREVIVDIAEHAGELRKIFLARPEVVQLLEE